MMITVYQTPVRSARQDGWKFLAFICSAVPVSSGIYEAGRSSIREVGRSSICEAGRSSICEAEEALFAKPGEAEMGIVLFLAPCYNIFIKFLCGRDFGQAEE